jgi:hypothetical protein
MALVHSPSIVTNGLVLYLDAANPKSYPGTGTGWSDLSGLGNNGTLINGVTYSNANLGTFTFDGVDDRITTPLSTAFQDFTICVWFFHNGNGSVKQRLIDKSAQNGFWIGKLAGGFGGGIKEFTTEGRPGQQTITPLGRGISLTDNQWHYLAFRRQGTTHTIFGDGITNTISGTVTGTALDSTQMQIGEAIENNGVVFNGNIPVVKVYNRALQDSEILQNFNALRGRFGI